MRTNKPGNCAARINMAVLAILSLLVMKPLTALASTWSEFDDAGESLLTADVTVGIGSLTTIDGELIDLGGEIDDVDLYAISIIDTTAFAVSVTAGLTEDNDGVMWLFDSNGFIVGGENFSDIFPGFDDRGTATAPDFCRVPTSPCLPEFFPGDLAGQPTGIYYLAFSLYETGPVVGPGLPLSGWVRDPNPFQTGPYSLTLSGVEFAQIVPVPPAMLLFASGLAFLGLIRGRLRR